MKDRALRRVRLSLPSGRDAESAGSYRASDSRRQSYAEQQALEQEVNAWISAICLVLGVACLAIGLVWL